MNSSKTEAAELLAYFQKNNRFTADQEELKMIEGFINRHKEGKFPKETPELIKAIQAIAQTDSTQLQYKPLQLLRFCSKPSEFRGLLTQEFLVKINEMMPEVTNTPSILI